MLTGCPLLATASLEGVRKEAKVTQVLAKEAEMYAKWI